MKKIFTRISLLLIFSVIIFACSGNKNSEENKSNSSFSLNENVFKGEINEGEVTLDASKSYKLVGPLIVQDGAKLIIPKGTRIEATGGTSAYIAIAQGGKIEINGTKEAPVVMTSGKSSPSSADWGGLVICGKAPTNKGGSDGQTATAEVSDLTYGGSDSSDSSGTIRYLRLEYTGANFTSSKEFNSLSLFGVGSGTTLEYVQSYKGSDDGIEFFGGTVNGRYLVSTDSEDDGIDFADGWSGIGENWYISGTARAGIEGSNNGEDGNREPITKATLKNISIIAANPLPDGNEGALYVKEGGGEWNASNIYVKGYGLGIKVKSNDEPSKSRIDAGKITFNKIQFDSETLKKSEYETSNTSFIVEEDNKGAGSGASLPDWATGWTK